MEAVGLDETGYSRKTALILKMGQIGDVIMAIPAAHALYEQGFEIHWVCGRAARAVLECYTWVHVVPVDDRAILVGSVWERIRTLLGLWSQTGFRQYDLCATLYYDSRFRLLALPVRARRKLMLSHRERERAMLAGRHHTDECVRLLLDLPDECRERSTPPVRPNRLPDSPLPVRISARRVALFAGGTSNVLGEQVLRRWPVDLYVVLAKLLLARGWEVVLAGGREDLWVRPHFEGLGVRDSLGTLSLPEVVSLCDACDGVVTHDTGPLHLAGLSRTCLVGLFGPTDPATRVPRREFSVGVWGGQGFACRPCYDGREFAPCRSNGCMQEVTPEQVLRELDRLLQAKAKGEPSPWRVVPAERG